MQIYTTVLKRLKHPWILVSLRVRFPVDTEGDDIGCWGIKGSVTHTDLD